MNSPFVDHIIDEGRARPFSTVALILLLAVVPFIYKSSASANDLALVKTQIATQGDAIDDIKATIKRNQLETKLQATQSDMFTIKERIRDRDQTHRYIDPMNYEQLDKLTIDEDRLKRKIALLPPPLNP